MKAGGAGQGYRSLEKYQSDPLQAHNKATFSWVISPRERWFVKVLGPLPLCPGPRTSGRSGALSDSGLEPPFSPTGLCIIETLAAHSHANPWTLGADVKHLVLFLLTCKELMQLFKRGKRRVGPREGWRWRGRGEGGQRGEFQKERKVYLNGFLSWWAKYCIYVNSSHTKWDRKFKVMLK